METYSLCGASFKDGKVSFDIQITGKAIFFKMNIEEIKKNISRFKKIYIPIISEMYAAYSTHNVEKINSLINKINSPNQPQISSYLLIFSSLYIVFMVIANLTGSKITNFLGYYIPAALYFFPFTYILDDILTEIYGFRISRSIIWAGFGINLLITIGCLLATSLPASQLWEGQHSFEHVFGHTPRIFIASIISYFFGEFINSLILSKLKILTLGKHFWLRAISSTIIAVIIDSIFFCTISFYGVLPVNLLISMIILQCIFKISYEIIMLPITTRIVEYIKSKENSDVFDFNISYNPFTWR
ncbi:MAG: queuosine precursor transporter [Sphingobacteriia bacterium]|nr:queuosine precursor transporter [Sphingobacteriia bacterium]